MLKNITRRGAWLGAAALIVMTISPAQAASKDDEAHSSAQAIHATGEALKQVFGPVLDGGTCSADLKHKGGTPDEKCGDNLNLGTQQTPVAYTQEATAKSNATSHGEATVAQVGIPGLENSLDLNNVFNGVQFANTSDLLNAVTGPVGALLNALGNQALAALIQPLNDALQGVLDQVAQQLNITVQVGGVASTCDAFPDVYDSNGKRVTDGYAVGSGTVTGINIVVTLPGTNTVTVQVPVDTKPNSQLVGSVPNLASQILNGVIASLQSSATLDGALAPLGNALGTVKAGIIDAILNQLEGPLTQLGDALGPIIEGTVNKQEPANGLETPYKGKDEQSKVNRAHGRKITVTALEATLLRDTPLEGGLQLAKVSCGANTLGDNNGGPGGKTDFQVLKTEKIKGDNKIEWTIKVRNPKSATAHDVVVKDFYPKGVKGDVEVEEGPSTGTFDEDTGVWKIPELGGKKVATLVIKAKVKKSKLDDGIKNTACAVTRNGAFRNVNDDKPDKIQKNDTFNDDTDGCDSSGSQKDKDDDNDTPKKIDSGVNGGGNLGALAATGLLAVAALGGTAVRQRRLVA